MICQLANIQQEHTPHIRQAGLQHAKLQDLAPQYFVVVKEFKDGGADLGLVNSNSVLRWEFTYSQLSAASGAVLDAHYAEAQGQFGGFNFRHPVTLVLYSNVRYESYEADHTKIWSQSRRTILIKRPA